MSKGVQFQANGHSTPSFFFEGLTLLFIALKLTGVINWSWWWVLAPFWIPASIALVFIGVVFSFVLLAGGRFRRTRFRVSR